MTETLEDRAAAGQISSNAARVYDTFFVPALFGQFAEPLVQAAGVSPGMPVLDVACGTGAATRAAAQASGSCHDIVGLDCNPGMLTVAHEKAPEIQWQAGDAGALPFADSAFDAVLCQFGLMFFPDRTGALGEMRRVLAPGGRAVLAVWADVSQSPGYDALTRLLARLFGRSAADALRAPFKMGDRDTLRAVLDDGGWNAADIVPVQGMARFPSLAEWMRIDVRGWTLAETIDDDQFEVLTREAQTELARFTDASGQVRFNAPAIFAVFAG
ncbi:MAG: methyltransferase domain-containing protein [Pseudomonadota bacterium]